jgi:uroporphyrinogen decarboxylase
MTAVNSMTPRQRFLSALEMQTPDRVPLFYQHLGAGNLIMHACGKTIMEGMGDPVVFAELAESAYHLFGFDNVMAGWGDILTEAQAHGTKWRFPTRDYYPKVESYGLSSIKDVDRIHPVDPLRDKYWSVPLGAASILQKRIGSEVEVVGYLNCPFMVASELMGYESLLITLLSEPDGVDTLLKTIVESEKMYLDHASADAGLDCIFIDDATAGMEQNSPELCMKHDLKHVKELIEYGKKKGLKTILHNCSAMPYLDLQTEIGPDTIHFNNTAVDLEATFAKLRSKLCVTSGIDHMQLLFKHRPAEIEAEVARVVALFGKEPGLILAPGCEMEFKTPLENIEAFKNATEKFGSY